MQPPPPEAPTGERRSVARPVAVPRPVADAAGRTYLLAAVLTLASIIAWSLLDLNAAAMRAWSLPIWAMASITFACGFMAFDVEFRRETYTFTFNEIVLIIGAFFAGPLSFLAARLIGEALFLTVRERQPIRKLVLNLSVILAESVVLIAVITAFRSVLSVHNPVDWLIALLAIVCAEMVGYVAIATVIRWHGGPITLRSIMKIGLVTTPANTSLAFVVVALAQAQPLALPLLALIAVFMVRMYRSNHALKQRYDSLNLLYEFTHLVSGAREPVQVLDAMLGQAKDTLRTERAEFWLATNDGLYRRHIASDEGTTSVTTTLPPALADVLDTIGTEREAALIQRGTTDPAMSAALESLGAGDALISPVRDGETLIGFVTVLDRLGDISTFSLQDARMFATLASHAGVALQNGRLIARLHEQARQREFEAHHDPLTGLPNRVLFSERLERRLARAGASGTGIALMDLDGFKDVNDTLGHQSGDAVLVEVGNRLRASTHDGTLVARLGGDEFALLAPENMSIDEFVGMCRRLRDSLASPMAVDHLSVNMGSSFGIAVAPTDGSDPESLIRSADVAMYSAKAGRGGGVCRYDSERDENSPRRLAIAHDIRTAVERGELHAVYQPKVSLTDHRVVGAECLCRWTHPVFGLVPPDEFIPLADRTGAIVGITRWILATALEQCERWAAQGLDWGVAVNVSMRNLLDNELVSELADLLQASSVEPDRITLEITETHVMSDVARTGAVLGSLAKLGVRLSIDDFGTGYSSLAYLQRLDVDEVKIDKSFVADLGTECGADAIVRSVIDLARNLDLRVVAEGVETAAAAARLIELGCDEAQGFFFSHPVPGSDMVPGMVVAMVPEPMPPRDVAIAASIARHRPAAFVLID